MCRDVTDRQALRFYGALMKPLTVALRGQADGAVLFVGMMHLFYVVWDYIDERLFDKRNTSDCSQFSELLGWPTSGVSTLQHEGDLAWR